MYLFLNTNINNKSTERVQTSAEAQIKTESDKIFESELSD